MVEDAQLAVLVTDDAHAPARGRAAIGGDAAVVPRRRRHRRPTPPGPRSRRAARRRRLRHLHLGLDRQAQGRARPAPRGRQLPARACAREPGLARRDVAARGDHAVVRHRGARAAPAADASARAIVLAHARRRRSTATRCARCSSARRHRACRRRRRPGACCSTPAGRAAPRFKALCGGEALPRDLAAAAARRACGELWNMYGPTETTVWSTVHRVDARRRRRSRSAARSPTRTVHVLDDGLQPVPARRRRASCYIGGDGVARGYLDRPELTAERFVPDPFRGDPARACTAPATSAAGAPTARSSASAASTSRSRCAASASSSARSRPRSRATRRSRRRSSSRARTARATCAWSPTSSRASAAPLAERAARAPRARRCPSTWCRSASSRSPRCRSPPNGKIDRKALPAPVGPALAADGAGASRRARRPRSAWSRAYRRTCSALPRLGVARRLLRARRPLAARRAADRAARRASSASRCRCAPSSSTRPSRALAALARRARPARGATRRRASRAAPTPRRAPLSLMQQRLWFLEQLQPGRAVYNVPSAHRLRGALDVAALRARVRRARRAASAVLRTVDRHAIGDAPAQRRRPTHVALRARPIDLSGLPPSERERELARAARRARSRSRSTSRAAPLFRARAVPARPPTSTCSFFMPHHIDLGRLVVRPLLRRAGRALRRVRAGRADAAAAAAGQLRRLRGLAPRLAGGRRARAPARVLARPARRRARRARAADRSPAPADAERRRRDRVARRCRAATVDGAARRSAARGRDAVHDAARRRGRCCCTASPASATSSSARRCAAATCPRSRT